MTRWPGATEHFTTPNRNAGGLRRPVYGLVVHIAEGTYSGTIAWQMNPVARVSSFHVVAYDGRVAQMMDDGDRAWTQAAGNDHWRGIEHEGFGGRPLTAQQVERLAQLIAYYSQLDGWPIRRVTTDPNAVRSQADGGVTHHGAGGSAWGGHFNCPGQPIINQLDAVMARARQIAGGDAATAVYQTEENDVQVKLAQQETVVLVSPTVASGYNTWFILASDLGDAVVRIAMWDDRTNGGQGGWQTRPEWDAIRVTAGGRDVPVTLLDNHHVRKISATLVSTEPSGDTPVAVSAALVQTPDRAASI